MSTLRHYSGVLVMNFIGRGLKMKLPTFNSIWSKIENYKELTPLEYFIYLCIPIDREGSRFFRKHLKKTIEFIRREDIKKMK
jgi:hypothetical protein